MKLSEYRPLLVINLGLIATVLLIWISKQNHSYAWNDAHFFHIPQINMFISRPFDVFHYPSTSATTPGYHLFVAWIAKMLGYASVSEASLPTRAINLAISCILIWLAWLVAWRLSGAPWRAAALILPFAASSYVISGASFATTDNMALVLYALALFLLVSHSTAALAMSAILVGVVACRQMYLPIGGALALSVFGNPWRVSISELTDYHRLTKACAVCFPAVLLLGGWAVSWGGLVPPEFEAQYGGSFNVAVPIHAVALSGLYGSILLLPSLILMKAFDAFTWRRIAFVSFLLALPLWLISPTTFDQDNGRWGSVIWSIAAFSPHIGDHSFVVFALTFAGISVLAVIVMHSYRHQYFPAEFLLFTFYLIGYSAQPFAWQRYIEPQILLMLCIFSARLPLVQPALNLIPIGVGMLSATMTVLHITAIL